MTPELKQDTMKNILIDYIISFKNDSDKYTKESLESLPDENLIAIADRIELERRIEKSKPCLMCGLQNCERC